MEDFSRREKYFLSNTLSCVPHILVGEAVLIDLRNKTSVAGRIDNADGYMNIELVEAVLIDQTGLQYPFEHFMVRERMIRQIHIPKHIEINEAIRQWIEHGLKPKKKRIQPREQAKGKRTFKQKRAETRHKEILQEIQKQQKDKQKDAN